MASLRCRKRIHLRCVTTPKTRTSSMPKYYRFEGKAISITQPSAAAIAFAGKNIENRSWRTHYRGPLAIHASGTLFRDDLGILQRVERGGEKRSLLHWINKGRKRYGLAPEEVPQLKQIVAIAMLTDCTRRSSSPWFNGEWGWVLEGIIPIEPIPIVGALSTWNCRFKYRPLSQY